MKIRHLAGVLAVVTCTDVPAKAERTLQLVSRDLLILKNPGNIIPPAGCGSGGLAATLEYAVKLGSVSDIAVLGHSECRVIAKLMDGSSGATGSAIDVFLQHAANVRRMMRDGSPHLRHDQLLEKAARGNVLVQAGHLRGLLTAANWSQQAPVRIHAWYYQAELGRVIALDEFQASARARARRAGGVQSFVGIDGSK